MAMQLKKSTKGALAVVVAASINGAFFLPSATAAETSDSNRSTGMRINQADCSRTQELQQANQAPQQVLQLLRGDENNSAQTLDRAEVGDTKDNSEEGLALAQRLNTSTKNLEMDDPANTCCTRIADEDFVEETQSRIRDADLADESKESERRNDLVQAGDDKQEDDKQEVLKLFGNDNSRVSEQSRIDDGEQAQKRLETGKRINTAGDDAAGLNHRDRETATCNTESLVASVPDSTEVVSKEVTSTTGAKAVSAVAQSQAANEFDTNSDEQAAVVASDTSDNGTADVDSGTLAKTGSTAQFAGLAAAIAATIGALMMFFSRKKRHQD